MDKPRWKYKERNRLHFPDKKKRKKKKYASSINGNKIRSFPGADTGSNHHLVMMTFKSKLKKNMEFKDPRVNTVSKSLKIEGFETQ